MEIHGDGCAEAPSTPPSHLGEGSASCSPAKKRRLRDKLCKRTLWLRTRWQKLATEEEEEAPPRAVALATTAGGVDAECQTERKLDDEPTRRICLDGLVPLAPGAWRTNAEVQTESMRCFGPGTGNDVRDADCQVDLDGVLLTGGQLEEIIQRTADQSAAITKANVMRNFDDMVADMKKKMEHEKDEALKEIANLKADLAMNKRKEAAQAADSAAKAAASEARASELASKKRYEELKVDADMMERRIQELLDLNEEKMMRYKEEKTLRRHYETLSTNQSLQIMELEGALMAMGSDTEHEEDLMAMDRKRSKEGGGGGRRKENRKKAQRKAQVKQRSRSIRMKRARNMDFTDTEWEVPDSSDEDDGWMGSVAEQMLPSCVGPRMRKVTRINTYDDLRQSVYEPGFAEEMDALLCSVDAAQALGPVPIESEVEEKELARDSRDKGEAQTGLMMT